MRAALLSRSSAGLVQAITGRGGVGKTQAAVEYAHRHAEDFDLVWWLRCEEPAVLAADYAALAGPLGLPEGQQSEQRAAIDAVRRWLDGHDRWLLVFDNAHRAEDLRGYLPRTGGGQVLITSRNPDWQGTGQPLHVELFNRAESIDYLLQRIGNDAADADGHRADGTGGTDRRPLPRGGAGPEGAAST